MMPNQLPDNYVQQRFSGISKEALYAELSKYKQQLKSTNNYYKELLLKRAIQTVETEIDNLETA